ncbi:MAG: CHAP domain-containing protein [Ignavibacteria bacterium]|nr:CHAP domain-containing protein [Ignavibacteria bacterium]
MDYPGRVIKKGEKDKKIVRAVQEKLNDSGCGPIDVDGDFGNKTFNAVKLFQARSTDENGNPLIVDGKIGPISWSTLFGEVTVPVINQSESDLLSKVVKNAKSQIGVLEDPVGSNGGPEVDEYLASVGLGSGFFWCMAFVYWCFNKSSKQLGINNPAVKTAGVIDHWNRTKGKRITFADAVNNPSKIKPGQIFIMSYGGGTGHTGIVESVSGGFINTIEGNTNEAGSRNGIGVFKRQRKINSINKGFIEYK